MSESESPKPFPALPSERMAKMRELVQGGRLAELSSTARQVWLALAIGWAGNNGRCWPERAKIMKAVGLRESATSKAVTELVAAGWLERLGRPRPGHTAELRVMIPGGISTRDSGTIIENSAREDGRKCARESGGIDGKCGRESGRMHPPESVNAPAVVDECARHSGSRTELGNRKKEQKKGTGEEDGHSSSHGQSSHTQQQRPPDLNPAAAEQPGTAFQEHPNIALVLDAAGIHAPDVRAEIAGVDGISLVIRELWRQARGRATKNPAGLLRKLVAEDGPAEILKARRDGPPLSEQEASEIYRLYPLQKAKAKAITAIIEAANRIAQNPQHPGQNCPSMWLADRVKAYAQSPEGETPEYIDEDYRPYAAKWFDEERYEDQWLSY